MTMKNNTLSLFIIFIFSVLLSSALAKKDNTVIIDVNFFDKIKYFSAVEYSKNAGLKYSFVEKKDKLIIQYKSKKIILSPNNSFMLIDDKAYNLSIPTIFDGNDFWIH